MKRWIRERTLLATIAAVIASTALASTFGSSAAHAADAQIKGSGSSWAANAVQQWISDVGNRGTVQVVYNPSGSATGRNEFAQSVVNFAVSDIGYQGFDKLKGTQDSSSRPYAYLPIVAGGTAFPYHLTVRGQLVRNLRLSQLTLAKILCDQITNWDDPAITADNNGHGFPSIPIVPVVHSEGAGTSFHVTEWINGRYPQVWQQFSGVNYPVEYWPLGKGNQVPESGSDSLISFIDSSAGQGSIGFDEYSYALQAGLPVVNLENDGGYFVAPDQYNVAVALTKAQINMDPSSPDYLLQTLNNVWTDTDPRAYPISSYSYLIEPTGTDAQDPTMDTAHRQSIVDYMTYALCQGQAEMGPIGYSPLPLNLVQASFDQLGKLKTADPNVSLANVNVEDCNNPTFDGKDLTTNELAVLALQPPACDQAGQGPCVAGSDVHIGNPNPGGGVPPAVNQTSGNSQGGGGSGPSPGSPSGSPTGSRSSPGSSGAAASSASGGQAASGSGSASTGASGAAGSAAVAAGAGSSATGAGSGGGGGTGTSGGSGPTTTLPVELAVTNLAADRVGTQAWALLAAVLVILVIGLPPAVTRLRARRRGSPQ